MKLLGGASVAGIEFLDIENIHVVRDSLKKVRDHYTGESPLNSSCADSKWAQHLASLLRGAVTIADSLNLGHPSLVHCSGDVKHLY